MGDHAANIYVRTHDRIAGPVGFAIGKHFTDGGFPDIVWSPEIPTAVYQSVHAQALQSQAAFDGAAAAAWGPFYMATFTDAAERAVLRGRVQKTLP